MTVWLCTTGHLHHFFSHHSLITALLGYHAPVLLLYPLLLSFPLIPSLFFLACSFVRSSIVCSSSSITLLLVSLLLLPAGSKPDCHGASTSPGPIIRELRYRVRRSSFRKAILSYCEKFMHLGKMNSRVREDERHEMIIRKLLKNTENKRCINCGSLGPQYVCTNFSIFVCTYCSGAHREFSHRIKSISMAKFTPGEVANLQSGGNGRAREIYFKELDVVRNPLPDSSDSVKLRNFINHVYVERRYTGERPAPKKSQEGVRDDYESRRLEARKPGLQSPSREDENYDRRNNERFNDRARKSDVGGYHNQKRSPNRFEPDRAPRKSYDDREGRREEKANADATRDRGKPPVRPFPFQNSEEDGPPIRSVKEILGDDVPSLRVDLNGRSFPGKIPAPVALQKDGRSQSLNHLVNGETTAQVPAVKRVSSESMISLIDFSADPEPVAASGYAADPFAPNPAIKHVSDPFAPTRDPGPVPPTANASIFGLFGSDPFAVAAVAKPVPGPFAQPVPGPFAPAVTLKQASDPFEFGSEVAGADLSASSWATFDFTSNSAPPEGYPGAFSASTARTIVTKHIAAGSASDTSSRTGSRGWSEIGLQTSAPLAFVLSTAPAPVATSSQKLNLFSTVESQINVSQSAVETQMGFPPQLTRADKFQALSSASGRIRRELPQDFFAQPGMFGMDARQDLALSMGVGLTGAPPLSQRGQHGAAQLSRTRNPFDDDGDPPPAPFNMGSMQAALPRVGDSIHSVAPQWGQSIPQFQTPATTAGPSGHGMQSTSNVHQQNGQPGGFGQNQGFNQGSIYGVSSFYSQTAGSNPFD